MTLYIDANEPSEMKATVKATIANRDTSASTEVKGLKTGDFVYKNVVVERKEASDLASSIKDNRLREQTQRMLKDFEDQYIIIEGDPYDLRYSNLQDNVFIGTLVSRGHAGCTIIYTPDQMGTAYAVNKIVSKHSDDEERRTVELNETNVEDIDTQVAMLAQIEGISVSKARKINDKIGLSKLCEMKHYGWAPAENCLGQIKEIDGIGNVLAQRIKKAFE